METSFNGKSVYVAMLHAPGIWHEHRLQEPYVDQDIALGWTMPFAAKWRADFCANAATTRGLRGSQDEHLDVPLPSDRVAVLVRRPARLCAVLPAVHRREGRDGLVLVYPSDRTKETPLATFTPVDIVRNTLGVGPCEYVLDREGLKGRSANTGRKNFGRGVCDTTTPIEYLFIDGIEVKENALVGHLVDDILADIHAINARVLEFRQFGEELGERIAAMPRESGPGAELLARPRKAPS